MIILKKKGAVKIGQYLYKFCNRSHCITYLLTMVVKEPEDSGVDPMRPAETGIIWNINGPVR